MFTVFGACVQIVVPSHENGSFPCQQHVLGCGRSMGEVRAAVGVSKPHQHPSMSWVGCTCCDACEPTLMNCCGERRQAQCCSCSCHGQVFCNRQPPSTQVDLGDCLQHVGASHARTLVTRFCHTVASDARQTSTCLTCRQQSSLLGHTCFTLKW